MKGRVYLIILVSILSGCTGDEEAGFISLIGSWTYTTPDEKIKIEFDIVGGNPEILAVTNQKIFVEGQEGKAEVQTASITETTFDRLRINANDADLDLPYSITFINLSASPDFSVINVEEAFYTFPWPDNNALTQIEIVRK